jgi:hypothetical protein
MVAAPIKGGLVPTTYNPASDFPRAYFTYMNSGFSNLMILLPPSPPVPHRSVYENAAFDSPHECSYSSEASVRGNDLFEHLPYHLPEPTMVMDAVGPTRISSPVTSNVVSSPAAAAATASPAPHPGRASFTGSGIPKLQQSAPARGGPLAATSRIPSYVPAAPSAPLRQPTYTRPSESKAKGPASARVHQQRKPPVPTQKAASTQLATGSGSHNSRRAAAVKVLPVVVANPRRWR